MGTMAGDVGFDPLGFSKSKGDLNYYREAEIKHARLAMLAAAGWPISELFDTKIANLLGMTPVLDETHRAPSVLNGGLGRISIVYWGVCLVIAGATEVYGLSRATKTDGYAGNLGFDPLGMYPKNEAGRKEMQTKEIKNGRIAMLAITAFAAQEFISHVAVIDQTPFFFKPVWEVLFNNAEPANAPAVFEAVTSTREVFEPVTSTPEVFEPVTSTPEVFEPVTSTPEVFEPVTTAIDSAVTTTVESATSAATPPVDTVSSPAVSEELIAAKKRIAELEAKLASISELTR